MIALPLAGYSATVTPVSMAGGGEMSQPSNQGTQISALNIVDAITATTSLNKFAAAQDPVPCSMPCQLDTVGSCDMAHGVTSCFVALGPTSSLAPPVNFGLVHVVPAELDPASYIPPLLDRPPESLFSVLSTTDALVPSSSRILPDFLPC